MLLRQGSGELSAAEEACASIETVKLWTTVVRNGGNAVCVISKNTI